MPHTIRSLQKLKDEGRPIVALTATDYSIARILDRSGVDLLLVGDSLAMVAHGHAHTLPVTVEDMLCHCRAVRRAVREALLVADLPFGSYEQGFEQAFATASRFLKEGGAQAVKLEGGYPRLVQTVAALVEAGVPVLAHLGLTPQAVHQLGGYRTQGRTPTEAERLRSQALALEAAGAFALVLECVPADLGAALSRELAIPTIGIGAGGGCDGQVLVTHDLLGLSEWQPSFARPYADLGAAVAGAVERFAADVRERHFPERPDVLESPTVPLSQPR